MTLPRILAIPTDGCGLIGAVWPGLYLEMSLWSLKGKGQRTKMVFYSTFCLFMWQRILSPRTSICISLATLCYKRFWERKWLHFQLLIGGGKEEGNQNGSSDPTHSFPTRGKAKVIVTETPGCPWCKSLPVSETLTCIDNSWKSRLFGSVYVGGISSWLSSGINVKSKEKTLPLNMESGSCVFTPFKKRT